MQQNQLEQLIALSIGEDIGGGDCTSLACIPADACGGMQLLVKQDCVLAGMAVARAVYQAIDGSISFTELLPDGAHASAGSIAFRVHGNVIALLQAERLVLNFMQRMCGIATKTARYVSELNGLKTKITDTRKTTPAMRNLEKMAVRLGGGVNHRHGLYDMVLIKDNHIDYAGGIANALSRVRQYMAASGRRLPIEIEARSVADVEEILSIGGIDRIMLDNFDIDSTRRAVGIIANRCEVESSGGITLDTLRQYALCGVDYISCGDLTHHIESIDLSLKAI